MFQPVMLQLITYGQLLLWTSLVLTANADEVNIAHLATISATPHNTYNGNDYKKENAVDGHIDTSSNNVDNCGCCYVSRAADDLHFTASFAGHYHVQQIVIIGRQVAVTPAQSLSDITVHLDDIPVQVDTSGTNRATVTSTSGSVQTLRITRRQTSGRLLFICEISVMATATNIAPTASLTASPFLTYRGRYYTKDQAVDGVFRGDATTCDCCYCSDDRQQSPYLQADLRHPLSVSRIVIEGRGDTTNANYNSVLTGVVVKLDSAAAPPAINRTINYLVVIPTSPLQVIRIEKPTRFLMICELKVFVANLNLLPRIKDSIHTSMSSVARAMNSSLALDGRYDLVSSFLACSCCSLTAGTEKPWWQLDLGRLYLIQDIHVIGRQRDYQQHSSQIISTISNSTHGNGTLTLSSNQSLGPTVYFYSFEQPRVFQYLTVSKQVQAIMTICEVILIEGVCPEHTGTSFGDKCSRLCHCANGKPCDRATGTCQSPGCLPGWMGDACDEACPHGSFGDHCSESCHCLNNANCNTVDGTCPNHLCAAGWILYNCSQACSHGSFGDNCSETCHCLNDANCNNVNGNCENHLCAAGWRLDNCSQVCLHGTFGHNCSTECHCLSDAECDHVGGACPCGLCEPGWQQDSCSQECDERTFGMNCLSECHCYNSSSCDKVHGTCFQYTDRCEAGWLSDSCSVVLASSVDHADTASAGLSVTVAAGMAVAGVVVGMLLMMGTVVLVLRLTRRHIVRSDRSHDVVAGRPQTDGHVSATEMHDVSSAIEVAGEGAQYEALDEPAADTPHIYTGLAQHPDEGVQYEALGGTDDSSHVYTGLAEQAATGDYTASHDSQYVNMFGK